MTPKRPRNGHKFVSLAVRVIAGLAVLVVLAGGFLAVRLARGPITIGGLGPFIAGVLDERFGHRFEFRLGDAGIVGHGYFPTFGIEGLALNEKSGRAILTAPRAEVSIDLFALLFGTVTPKRLEIFDVELHLALLPDGSLALPGPSDTNEAMALTPPLVQPRPREEAVAAASGPGPASEGDHGGDEPARRASNLSMDQACAAIRVAIDLLTSPESPIGAIDRLGITRGRLLVDDRTLGRMLTFRGVDAAFDKSAKATTFDLSVDGPNGRWSATGRAEGAPGTEHGLRLTLRNLSLDEILLASGARNLGADSNMPLSTEMSVALRADGAILHASGRIELGAGYLRFDDPEDEPMMIDKITVGFRLEPATGRIVIEPSRLVAGTTLVSVAGTVTPPATEGASWTIGLSAAGPNVAGPERPGQAPVRIESGELTARLFLGDKKVVIDRFAFNGPDCGFAMAGTIDWTEGPRVRLGASVNPTPVKAVLRLWPSFIVAPVRAWLLAHASEGVVQSGTLQVDFDAPTIEAMRAEQAPPDDSVLLDFAITGGGLELFTGVPPMQGFDGKGHVTGRTSTFIVSNGTIDLGDGRKIAVQDGRFHVSNAALKPVPALITARVSATVETIAKLLAYDRLKPYAKVPLDLANLRGQVDGTLALGLKLDPAARPEDSALESHVVVSNFSADHLIGDVGLDSGSLTLDIDPSGLRANGQGRIFGAPATFDVTQAAGKPAKASVKLTLDEDFLATHGLGAAQGVTGPIGVAVQAPLGTGDKPTAEVELDLSKAAIEVPGISKPEGRPARITFNLVVKDKATSLERVAVDAGTVEARGTVELGADHGLLTAKFPLVKLSSGDDMKVDVLRVGDGLKVIVRGSAIDARPFLKSLIFAPPDRRHAVLREGGGAGSSGAVKEIEYDVKSSLLSGYNKSVVTGAELRLLKRGDEIKQLTIAGRFGREPLSANLTGVPVAPLFSLVTDDAGSLLAFLDLYKRMEGGRLSVGMRLDPGSLDGLLVIKDFVLRDEPAMRRLVDEGIPAESGGRQQKIDAGAVAFSNLQVRFQRVGSRLDLTDGTMSGAAIGLTVDGWLDYVADRVDVTGTFIPVYGLNNLFSQIPLFGPILGGGTNEGLFGVNYRIEGKASAPTLSINPLSMIAPGIFRRIFGVGDNSVPAGAVQ